MDYDDLQARRAARARAEEQEAHAQRESDIKAELDEIRAAKGLPRFVPGAKQAGQAIARAWNAQYGAGN